MAVAPFALSWYLQTRSLCLLTTSAAFHIWSPPTLNMRRICFCVFVLIYYFLNFMPSLKEHFSLFISHPPLFLSALINFTKDIFNISLVFSKLPSDCFLSFRYSSKNFLCNPWFRSKKSYLISNTSIIIYFDHFRVLHFCSCNSLIKLRTLIPLIFFLSHSYCLWDYTISLMVTSEPCYLWRCLFKSS